MKIETDTFNFIKLLLGPHNKKRAYLIAWLLAATFSTAAAVGLIISMVGDTPTDSVDFQRLALFLIIAGVVVFSQSHVLNTTVDVCETAVEKQRSAFTRTLRYADIEAVEKFGTARLYGILNRTTTVMQEAGPPVVYGLITACIMTAIAFYIVYLSVLGFVVMLTVTIATVYVFRFYIDKAKPLLNKARRTEHRYLELFVQLIDGIKEVKLNKNVGDALLDGNMYAAAVQNHLHKQAVVTAVNKAYIGVYAGFYLLLAAVVFAIPQYLENAKTVTKIIYITVFLLTTLNVMLRALPMLFRANQAIAELESIKKQLLLSSLVANKKYNLQGRPVTLPQPPCFQQLELNQVMVRFHDADNVSSCDNSAWMGFYHLKVQPGEFIALTGPTGGGKTTLLRTLCGLQPSFQGEIIWDGKPLTPETDTDYRELFSAVFSDSHHFDYPYGYSSDMQKQVIAQACEMGLPLRGSSLEALGNTHWSRAQKQRLLLAVALCEQRPVLILDDIEAGQDQRFLDHLKTVVFPRLKQRGVTVVFATAGCSQLLSLADRTLEVNSGVNGQSI